MSQSSSQSASSSAKFGEYCPICGKDTKSDRFLLHLKACAKKHHVPSDLVLEWSEKLPKEGNSQSSQTTSTKLVKPKTVSKKRKSYEEPNSYEDEALQLAVALSASVQETHVSHLPTVTVPEAETKASKRARRDADIFNMLSSRDPAEGQTRLLELIAEKFPETTGELHNSSRVLIGSQIVEGRMVGKSRLFAMTCSSPKMLMAFILNHETLKKMPIEFHIDVSDLDIEVEKNLDMATPEEAIRISSSSDEDEETSVQPMDADQIDTVGEMENSRKPSPMKSEEETSNCPPDIHPLLEECFNDQELSNDIHTNGETEENPVSKSDEISRSPIFDYFEAANEECEVISVKTDLSLSPVITSRTSAIHTAIPTDDSKVDQSTMTEPVLKSSSNSDRVCCNMLKLFQSKKSCDLYFVSMDGTQIGAHRAVVEANCPSLVPLSKYQTLVTVFENKSSNFIKGFLEFCYAGREHKEFQEEIDQFYTSYSKERADVEGFESSFNDGDLMAVINGETPIAAVKSPLAPLENSLKTPLSFKTTGDNDSDNMVNNDFENPGFEEGIYCTQTNFVVTEEENDLVADFCQDVEEPVTKVKKKEKKRVSIGKVTTYETPANKRRKSIRTPPYSQMGTPNLVKLLGKYGVRKLPKKHMVLKMKEIHRLVLKPKGMQGGVESEPPIADEQPSTSKVKPSTQGKSKDEAKRKWKRNGRYNLDEIVTSSDEEPVPSQPQQEIVSVSDDEEELETTIEPNALSLLDDILEDDDDEAEGEVDDDDVAVFFTQSQQQKKSSKKKSPKIVLQGEEFSKAVAAFIQTQSDLYNDILQYKPILFKDVYSKVRKVGNFACSKQQLVDFLDEQVNCIKLLF